MLNIETIASHYNLECQKRLQNPGPSGVYSKTLQAKNPRNAALGFGCADLLEHLSASELKGKAVLDVGCGAGADMVFVMDTFQPQLIHGIDVSEVMVATANARFENPGLLAIHSEILAYEPKQRYDCIISNAVIHLNENKEGIFRHLRNLLNPEGVLLLAEFVTAQPIPEILRAEFLASKGMFLFGGLSSQHEMLSYIHESGFEEVEIINTLEFDPTPSLAPMLSEKLKAPLKTCSFRILVIKAMYQAKRMAQTIPCPNCRTSRNLWHLPVLNVQIHRGLHQALREGRLLLPCRQCQRLEIELPMQYHDMDAKLMLIVFPPEQRSYRQELVSSLLSPMRARLPHYKVDLAFGLGELLSASGS